MFCLGVPCSILDSGSSADHGGSDASTVYLQLTRDSWITDSVFIFCPSPVWAVADLGDEPPHVNTLALCVGGYLSLPLKDFLKSTHSIYLAIPLLTTAPEEIFRDLSIKFPWGKLNTELLTVVKKKALNIYWIRKIFLLTCYQVNEVLYYRTYMQCSNSINVCMLCVCA